MFGWLWSKLGVGLYPNEWMNLADSLHANYIFRKAKSYCNSYWVGMVKYGCSL